MGEDGTDGGPAAAARPAHIRTPVFFGWYLVAAGSTIQILVGALMQQAFGAYAAALTNEFGWSRGVISTAFSLSRVESGILGPVQGWMLDRYGPRAVMRIGLVMFGVGFMLFSQLNSLLTFFVFFTFMAIGSSLGGFMAVTVAVVNWFDRYRARALGMAQVGFAFGGLLAPGVILAITRLGWRETAFASGVIILVVGLPLTRFMVREPAEKGLTVDGLSPEEVESQREEDRLRNRRPMSSGVDFTAAQAMRTLSFWSISAGHASALFVVSAVMVHLFLHLTVSLDYTDAEAALFIGLMTISQMLGQVGGAALGDVINKRVIIVVCMGMHSVGILLLAHIGDVWAVATFAVLHGAAWGTRGPLMQAIRADYFGRASFGKIMGFSSMIVMLGTMIGPVIAGVLYDRTGSYEAGFTVIAVMAALGSIFFVISRRPATPSTQVSTTGEVSRAP